jgi:hypothetical protein
LLSDHPNFALGFRVTCQIGPLALTTTISGELEARHDPGLFYAGIERPVTI